MTDLVPAPEVAAWFCGVLIVVFLVGGFIAWIENNYPTKG